MWLLDTNAWIRYLNPGESGVKTRLRLCKPDEIVLCDIVKAELYFGAYNSQRVVENLHTLDMLFSLFRSLPFDGEAARVYGRIRAELARTGRIIGPYDLQIAAVTLRHDLTLVTHNVSEFGRIASLRLEDWEM